MSQQSEHLKLFDESTQRNPEKVRFFSEIDIFKPNLELKEEERRYVQIIKTILSSDSINWIDLNFEGKIFREDSVILEVCRELSTQINIVSTEIFAALTYPLTKLSDPNNPYLSEAIYPEWITAVSLVKERSLEERYKDEDQNLVSILLPHLSRVFGFELSTPIYIRYGSPGIISHSLSELREHVHHVICMDEEIIPSAEDLGISGDSELVEMIYKMIIFIHELSHAFTTEAINPLLRRDINNNQPDTLVGIIQEGISTMAEKELLLTLIDVFREKASRLAEISFALLKMELSNKSENHYQKGFEVFRKLRGNGFKELLSLVRNIGIEELTKYSVNDPQYSQFLQDPLAWLQNHQHY